MASKLSRRHHGYGAMTPNRTARRSGLQTQPSATQTTPRRPTVVGSAAPRAVAATPAAVLPAPLALGSAPPLTAIGTPATGATVQQHSHRGAIGGQNGGSLTTFGTPAAGAARQQQSPRGAIGGWICFDDVDDLINSSWKRTFDS